MLQVVEQLWNANPLQNVLPINWVEITRALQTLWAREIGTLRPPRSGPPSTTGASSRPRWRCGATRRPASGVCLSKKEEENRPDKRFAGPEWENNPFYQTLKESYLLASEYLLNEAEKTDGQDTEEQRRLKFHLKQFVDAMAPVNFLLTNPAALRRITRAGDEPRRGDAEPARRPQRGTPQHDRYDGLRARREHRRDARQGRV